MANDLYAHTMTIHNGVSVRNVQYICQKYNIPFKNEFSITEVKIAGIKNLTFKREKYPGGDRFEMKIQINIGRLIKKSNYSMTVINNKTVNRIITSMASFIRIVIRRYIHLWKQAICELWTT